MTVKNSAELEKALKQQLKKAMSVGSKKVLADMYESAGSFYTGGEPVLYERTGALGDTPETTDVTVDGDTVSFKAYFDDAGGYSTGKNPTMHDVLDLANYGITNSSVGNLRRTVGKSGFVEEADKKIEQTMDSVLSQFF